MAMPVDQPLVVGFVCRHGAAKSVLAAAALDRLAADRRLEIRGQSFGLTPEPSVSPRVVEALGNEGVDLRHAVPRRVRPADLAGASRVITFDLDPTELPVLPSDLQAWDDVPAVSAELLAARATIERHVVDLLEEVDGRRSR
jgi:arsenate reductase